MTHLTARARPVRDGSLDERTLLERTLDIQRLAVVERFDGLTEAQVRERRVASRTTLLGIVQHLVAVEQFWFQMVLLDAQPEQIEGFVDNEAAWDLSLDDTVASVVGAYESACAASRLAAVEHDLDAVITSPEVLVPVSLRLIYLRMTEEVAQHVGHADILRELIAQG